MREIKFRGKRIDNGKWVYGDLTRYSEEISYITVDLLDNIVYKVYTHTVGQYVGLQAKYNTDIYEGDYCKTASGFIYLVKWDNKNCAFIFYMESQGWKRWRVTKATITKYKIEIIGNIYDNSRLA